LFNKPIETKQCLLTEKSIIKDKEKNNNKKLKNNVKYSLPDITGYLLNPPENTNSGISTLIVSVIIIGGLFGYFLFIYKTD
jgi:hypothetical protein|tara:strand:+ start:451 stop:693 length:243 start_codon:yes stop_codon:yes gene_type:complete